MATILFFTISFLLLIVPFILTIFNIINLFKDKKIKENIIDSLTFILGIAYTFLLYFILNFKDYQETLRIGGGEIEFHAPIASWSIPTVMAILIVGVISYFLIRVKKLNLPPLMIVLSMSGILICSIYMVIFMIQISMHNPSFTTLFYLFPINYILCSLRAVISSMNNYKEKNIVPKEYDNKFLNMCNKTLYNIENWPILAVLFAIPLVIILICILMLFGQRPDEAIKAFLETSDWRLSQKISPPSVTYDAHYLCTVSLRGHQKLVKPIRMGIRRGEKIVVNRQLCIANAFEDLIKERTPKFHHFIRYVYDKYGYPLSKHINTAIQADIVYIIMKPLEWIFLMVLYLFDEKPESRIAIQYIGKSIV